MDMNLFSKDEVTSLTGGGNSDVRNIALLVQGYELDVPIEKAVGIRLDTGEEVKIGFDAERIEKSRVNKSYAPPSIRTFAQANGAMANRRVHIGGIILFSAVFTDNEGNLLAGWPTVLKHNSKTFTDPNGVLHVGDENHTSYIYGLATFNSYVSTRDQKAKGGVTILLTNENYGEHLAPELKERLTVGQKVVAPRLYKGEKALEQTRKYSEALFERGLGVVIRFHLDTEKGKFNVLSVDPMRNYGENPPAPKEWFERRVQPILGKPNVVEAVTSGGVAVEVIPMLSATLSSNFKLTADPKSVPRINKLNDRFNVETVEGMKRLYTLSHVSLYQAPERDGEKSPLVLSSISPELVQDSFIGADGAGYFAETEFGKGTDDGLAETGAKVQDYKVPYVRKTAQTVSNAVQQATNAYEQESTPDYNQYNGQPNYGQSQPSYAPPPNNFDDDIPF